MILSLFTAFNTSAQNSPIPIDQNMEDISTETAIFALGCFWGPDASFGALEGVVRTRVGYAGGTTENPSYKIIGDHTETIEIDYDPNIISYQELVEIFFDSHNPYTNSYSRQYA
jgi:peptide methionine sulfoxide reductase msrA/msrB